MLGVDCVIFFIYLLWHSLGLPYNYFGSDCTSYWSFLTVYFVAVDASLCLTWEETPITDVLASRPKYNCINLTNKFGSSTFILSIKETYFSFIFY